MSDIEKIRESISFGARTGDPELTKAVYQLEPEGPEVSGDNGPKVLKRICSRCRESYLVSARHAKSVSADSLFNLCEACLDYMADRSEDAPLSPTDDELAKRMMKELLGDEFGSTDGKE